jgi:ABC-type multidrug transport system ATPase subunit
MDISLKAGPGILGLLGPKGSGKSTYMQLLASEIKGDATLEAIKIAKIRSKYIDIPPKTI